MKGLPLRMDLFNTLLCNTFWKYSSEQVDQSLTKNMNLIGPFHNLFGHMNFVNRSYISKGVLNRNQDTN